MEREIGVRHRVDVAMVTNIAQAAQSDQIADTIDYREVHRIVVSVGRENSFHLIETLASKIARQLLERFAVEVVEVSVEKETPVLDGMVDTVGVSLQLRREDLSR
jgi:dihydroneopterin aldolase